MDFTALDNNDDLILAPLQSSQPLHVNAIKQPKIVDLYDTNDGDDDDNDNTSKSLSHVPSISPDVNLSRRLASRGPML